MQEVIDESVKAKLTALSDVLNVHVKNEMLLLEAVTRSSYRSEHASEWDSNERLEFLGDSILGLIISEALYERFPSYSEGELSVFKSHLVSADFLADIARGLKLGDYLLLAKGDEQSGGRIRTSALSDLYESLIAAVYLDSGLEEAKRLVLSHFGAFLKEDSTEHKNSKNLLQEKTQGDHKKLPKYVIFAEPASGNDNMFCVGVFVDGIVQGKGFGKSKKEAEIAAASQALINLDLL